LATALDAERLRDLVKLNATRRELRTADLAPS
jgi:hypothetical protein